MRKSQMYKPTTKLGKRLLNNVIFCANSHAHAHIETIIFLINILDE